MLWNNIFILQFILFLFDSSIFIKAIVIQCEGIHNFTSNYFPVHKAGFGNNYELTLRSTNKLLNETAKLIEQNFNGTLVVQKWTRLMEMGWYNRSILFTDHYNVSVLHDDGHLEHNYTCHAIKKTTHAANAIPLSLSSELLHALHIDGDSFDQLLTTLSQQKYNGSMHTVLPVMGIDTVGWLGCHQNLSATGINLQLDIRFSGGHTPELPYNPFWNNPLIYTVDLIFYETEGGNFTIFDSMTYDLVTLDQVQLNDKEFASTPPRGVYCQDTNFVELPVKFAENFLVYIQKSTRNKDRKEPKVFINSIHKFFYHNSTKIVAFNKNLFDRDAKVTNDNNSLVIHDFVYGFQYTIADNGTCQSITAIDLTEPDVCTMKNTKGETLLYLLNPEQILLGVNQSDKYHYVGKVKSAETEQSLAIYTANKTQHTGSRQQELLEILFTTDDENKPAAFHSIIYYNGTRNGLRAQQKSIQILMASNHNNENHYDLLTTPWHVLHSAVRPCVQLMESKKQTDVEELTMFENGTVTLNNGDFYIQLVNVTLSDLEGFVGNERAVSALSQALASYANVSELRIIDLHLKQLVLNVTKQQQNGVKQEGDLFALFSIGLPFSVRSGVKPSRTVYFKEEISIEQAAALLNESVQTNQLYIHIPLDNTRKGKHDLNITVRAFGYQSNLYPVPAPSPCPTSGPPKFVGYSGSALAISAVFAFIFGASLVLGSYMFYQKRQHIRGFAYQVFE